MRLDDFDYRLPADRIAQRPLERRDASRLMVLGRRDGSPADRRFSDLPDLLLPGDLLVVNDTRVRPCRLRGRRAAPGTGGAIEVTFLGNAADGSWRALMKGPGRPGDPLAFPGGLTGRVLEREGETATLEILPESAEGGIDSVLERSGTMPLPPYIRRQDGDPLEPLDRERYQTVYASEPGAIAAPTAGLHLTRALLDRIRARGIEVASLTLHVGPGTFRPVRCDRIEDHVIDAEEVVATGTLADAVEGARRRKGRVVAVGTTVTRSLEWLASSDGRISPRSGPCDLFIYPGFSFRVVDALITNFHLPRSTLLMLVSAFAGRERVLAAYAAAIEQGYRFYSYGDAMLIA